ncbi:MAG: hypothetical protein IJ145_09685 [Prevotella sp.]|nr:hypothetical protein [Prevotella sp.]
MKKIIMIMVTLLAIATTTKAMTYAQAREQALFLTDKMAYELNLTEEQYEAAYEINFDYLMQISGTGNVYAAPWRQRNTDLSYILYDWQYAAYEAASYFFRPVFWNDGYWHFSIYAYYPHRTHYYFSRPAAYVSYRGTHSWRRNSGRSWYVNRVNHYRPAISDRRTYSGMRDGRHNNGNYRHSNNGNMNSRQGNRYDNRSNYNHSNNQNYRSNGRNYNNNRQGFNSNGQNYYNNRSNGSHDQVRRSSSYNQSRTQEGMRTGSSMGTHSRGTNMGTRSGSSMGTRSYGSSMGTRSGSSMGTRSTGSFGTRSTGSAGTRAGAASRGNGSHGGGRR